MRPGDRRVLVSVVRERKADELITLGLDLRIGVLAAAWFQLWGMWGASASGQASKCERNIWPGLVNSKRRTFSADNVLSRFILLGSFLHSA